MAWNTFNCNARFTANSLSWTIPIWNMRLDLVPYVGSGATAVKLFDGRYVQRVDGWHLRATFNWPQVRVDDNDAIVDMICAAVEQGTVVVDFDYTDNPGVAVETFVLEDVQSAINATFNGRGRARPVSLTLISNTVLTEKPDWLIGGESDAIVFGTIYYVTDAGDLLRGDIADGGNETVIFEDATFDIQQVALDPTVQNPDIYFATGAGDIYRCNRDGLNAVLIYNGTAATVQGLRVDVANDYIFMLNNASITRIALDGTGATTIASTIEDFSAGNVTDKMDIDRENQLVYFGDNESGNAKLKRVTYAGASETTLLSQASDGIAAIRSIQYYADGGAGGQIYLGHPTTIGRYDIDADTYTPNLITSLTSNQGLTSIRVDPTLSKIYYSEQSPENSVSSANLDGSSPTAIATETNMQGMDLGVAPPEITTYPELIFTEAGGLVKKLSSDGSVSLLATLASTIRGVTTDDAGNIYVFDPTLDKITKMNSAGGSQTDIVTGIADIYGGHWYDGNIYYARRGSSDTISWVADDGTGGHTLILSNNGASYPRVKNGIIYFLQDGAWKSITIAGASETEIFADVNTPSGGGGDINTGTNKCMWVEWAGTEVPSGDSNGTNYDADSIAYVDNPGQAIYDEVFGEWFVTDGNKSRIIGCQDGGATQRLIAKGAGGIVYSVTEAVQP